MPSSSRLRGFPALALGFLIAGPPALAGVWIVDVVDDEDDGACVVGDCSLREAVAAAQDGDTVAFALPPPDTITLTLGQISIAEDITIDAQAKGEAIVRSGGNHRIFVVQAGADVTLAKLFLRDGRAPSIGDKHGGCVLVLGALTLDTVFFETCGAWNGAIDSHTEGGDGGALYVAPGATLTAVGLFSTASFAGTGGGSVSPPPSFAGGRGGALAVAGTATVSLAHLFVNRAGNGGGPVGAGGDGGAIAALAGGSLVLDHALVESNSSGDAASFMTSHGPDGRGGGVFCAGDCALNNVTISGNRIGQSDAVGTVAQGGGLHVAGGTTRLRNVTVADNIANGNGGGIARSAGTLVPRHSMFAFNAGSSVNDDCFTNSTAGLSSEGYNLIRVNNGCGSSFGGTDLEGTSAAPLDPRIGQLQPNGFPIATYALDPSSPAIDAGDPLGCQLWNGTTDLPMIDDQRLFPRPTDGNGDTVADCDLGAHEVDAAPPLFVDGFESGNYCAWSAAVGGVPCPLRGRVANSGVRVDPAER